MSALVHCIYTSVQTTPLTVAETTRLVQESRQRNIRQGITGILLHVEDTYFQVLEGAPEVIDDLYSKILQDARHTRITRIIYESIARRYFEDCSMTLATLTPEEFTNILQEHNPELRERLLDGLDEGRSKRLLRAFNDGRWRTRIGSASSQAAVPA
ncbi:MAG: BLUF domain-containing protein [Janthinobacterium lividum]